MAADMLLVAALLGALLGTLGARTNRVRTSDEHTLWLLAGAVGGPLAVLEWGGLVAGLNAIAGTALAPAPVAVGVLVLGGVLGALFTPSLDGSGRPGSWRTSFTVKWLRSPLATTAGILAYLAVRARGGRTDFRDGMLFVEVGPGPGALTLGAVAWCRRKCFRQGGKMSPALARHEAVHSRTVAAVGELGFYLTYLTAGTLWGLRQGGRWNDLTEQGCGQPFEKTAHTYTRDPAVANRCREPEVRAAGAGTT